MVRSAAVYHLTSIFIDTEPFINNHMPSPVLSSSVLSVLTMSIHHPSVIFTHCWAQPLFNPQMHFSEEVGTMGACP